MRTLFLFVFCFYTGFIAKAQSNTNWNMMDNYLINYSSGIPTLGSHKLKNYGYSASLSDSSGRLILYTNGREVRDGNHQNIANGIISYYGGGFSSFLQINDSVIYLIQTRNLTGKKGLVYSKIIKLVSGMGIDSTQKTVYLKYGNDNVLNSGSLGIISSSRDADGGYFFSSCINDTFFNFHLDVGFKLVSFLPCQNFLILQRPIWSDSLRYIYGLSSFFDPSGNTLYIFVNEIIELKKLMSRTVDMPITNSVSIYKLPLDKTTGLFYSPQLVFIKNTGYKNYPTFNLNEEWEIESINSSTNYIVFSLDDSLLYFNTYKYKVKLTKDGIVYTNLPKDTLLINQLNPYSKKHFTLDIHYDEFTYPYGLLMSSPDGKIYYCQRENNSGLSISLDVINNPKIFGMGCNLKLKAYSFQLPTFLTSHEFNMYTIFDYVRINYKINYNCRANIQFTNTSLSEAKFGDYTWYINKLNGKTDTLRGATPSMVIVKSGKYPYKVFGHSAVKQYGEWFYDTLFVTLPEKPISNFKATDTIICRYLPLQFNNLSYAKEIKPGTQEKYVWTFGDGSPSSNDKEPTHTYTQPGIYTVSLFYSNGYCDSTLTKNQYIRVVDAPKPGFTAGIKQGCSPFTANFSDTVSLNVTKKEYLFSDSSKWRTVSTPKFKYTFNKPGHYWAVQKLYGYTGCVIRTDSVQFFVSKGLLPTDSIAITLASFDTLNHLHLEWDSHPAATSYSIYRSADGNSFSFLTSTSLTNYTDIGVIKKPNYYKVLAVDSCGKLSSAKNMVKPQWLSGERLPANEAALLTYVPDEGLGIPQNIELEWTYQHAINLKLGETNPVNPYRDDNFANPGFLKKCYRVTALHNGKKMYGNYECINFEPQTFIPNSFTPNGDGLNDNFLPTMMGIVGYEIKVFSRWGELLYSGSSPWNGTRAGQPVEGGVFIYSLNLVRNDRRNEFHRGLVHVIK